MRGLKHAHLVADWTDHESHPSWVRGLKLLYDAKSSRFALSHPSWVRGLKLARPIRGVSYEKSHPSWVRGLKHLFIVFTFNDNLVAPLVGAWIETGLRPTA